MVLERRDPIPTGYYYIDLLTESQRKAYSHWIRTVNTLPDSPQGGRVKDIKNVGTWKLFQIKKQVPRWGDSARLGFPTVAPYGEKTDLDDIVQSPDVDTIDLDDVTDLAKETSKKAALGAVLAAASVAAIPVAIIGSLVWVVSRIGK